MFWGEISLPASANDSNRSDNSRFRIVAIALASDSAIAVTQFCPIKVPSGDMMQKWRCPVLQRQRTCMMHSRTSGQFCQSPENHWQLTHTKETTLNIPTSNSPTKGLCAVLVRNWKSNSRGAAILQKHISASLSKAGEAIGKHSHKTPTDKLNRMKRQNSAPDV